MSDLKITPEVIKEQGIQAQELNKRFKTVIEEFQKLLEQHQRMVGFSASDDALGAKFAEIVAYLHEFKPFLDDYSQYLLRTVEMFEEQLDLEKNNPDLFNAFK